MKQNANWKTFGKPFIENAWPRELRFQTSETANNLAEVAQIVGDDFPEAVETVLPVLVPVEYAHLLLAETQDVPSEGDNATQLHRRFPESFLSLLDHLIASNSRSTEYGLAAVIRGIATAAPALRQDPRWRRLNDLATRG